MARGESSEVDDSADLDELLTSLYAEDLDTFVERRSAMVKQLRSAGRRDDAGVLGKARKPTVAAWAVNVVARANPDQVRELLAAGERLREAQDALLGGGSPADLRSAMDDRRRVVRTLTDDAVARVAGAGGNGEGARDDIAGTFEAASLDEDVARDLVAGRLTKTARAPVGFDLLSSGTSAVESSDEPEAPARPADERRRARAKAREARAAADEAEEAVEGRREEVERLEAEAKRLQRALERAQAELEDAEAEAERLREAADAAEAEVDAT